MQHAGEVLDIRIEAHAHRRFMNDFCGIPAGCNLETIRYYEKIGLLAPPARSDSGHRLYAEDDQARLRFILRGRELGFTIEELRSLLSLVESGAYTCGEIHELTRRHLVSVSQKIRDLRKLERTLTSISSQCARGADPECPVIEALTGSS